MALLKDEAEELVRILLLVAAEGGHQLAHRVEQLQRPHWRLRRLGPALEQLAHGVGERRRHLGARVGLAAPALVEQRPVQRRAAAQIVRERRAVRQRLQRWAGADTSADMRGVVQEWS